MKQTLGKILGIIGEILAVVLITVFLLHVIDAKFPFISKVPVLAKIVSYAITYGFLLLAAIVGVSAALKRSWILAIILLAMVAVIVIFTFFPGVLPKIGL